MELLVVLRADSASVDVQDGERLRKGIWTIDPGLELDTFNAARTSKSKTVTFISDVDRLSFEVQPNKTYDFVILYQGKQRCKTRLSTMVQPFHRIDAGDVSPHPETIPFTFDRGVIMVKARVNGSQ